MYNLNVKDASLNFQKRSGDLKCKKILFVSDDRFTRMVIRGMLKDENYSLVMAYDGRDGYEKYVKYRPQLIITDIEIPQISGLELCKIIKLDINDRKTPVILYTSSTKMENVERAFEYRANAYITKNQRLERLKEQIERLLS